MSSPMKYINFVNDIGKSSAFIDLILLCHEKFKLNCKVEFDSVSPQVLLDLELVFSWQSPSYISILRFSLRSKVRWVA